MEHNKEETFSVLKTMQLNDQKAGMEGLDKDEINRIIHETSKGTPYFIFQEKRQKSIDSKIKELQMKMKNITDADRRNSLRKIDTFCEKLERERDLSHSIVHIDMDAFYAAVEMRDNPELKEKPMAVGSSSMLSTSNYNARKFGVRAAMPGFIAKKLCPELIIVPLNFDKYRMVSHQIRKIVEEYDPDYSAASLDEVYLDLTDYIKNRYKIKKHEEYCLKNDICETFDDEIPHKNLINNLNDDCMGCVESINDETRDKMAYDIVIEIRQRIHDVTQLTASAGIAPNTMLAKVCSDQNKPNGQYQICSSLEAVKSFIASLPVKKVSGIGPVQGQILNAIGIVTCIDMWSKRDLVANLFSSNSTEFYMEVAQGIGSTTVRSDYKRKSIGNERTFKEIYKPEELHKKCKELCEDLIDDMKSHNVLGKVIVLKIKTSSFETHTRNHSLQYHTADPDVIYKAAKKLLDAEIAAIAPQPLKLRLMGIRMCNLMYEDSVPKSHKQQVTLKNFLQSKANQGLQEHSTENPSGSKEICKENNFDIFSEHIENCVKNNNLNEKLETNMQNSLRIETLDKTKECSFTRKSDALSLFKVPSSKTMETFTYMVSENDSNSLEDHNIRKEAKLNVQCSSGNIDAHEDNRLDINKFNNLKPSMVHVDFNSSKEFNNLQSFSQYEKSELLNNTTQFETFTNAMSSKNLSSPQNTSPECLEKYEDRFSFFSEHSKCLKNGNFKDKETVVNEQSTYAKSELSCIDKEAVIDIPNCVCPVCGFHPHVDNLNELNNHIDSCLNKKAIKEILSSELQTTLKRKIINTQKGSSKRIKESRKEKKIDEYFHIHVS